MYPANVLGMAFRKPALVRRCAVTRERGGVHHRLQAEGKLDGHKLRERHGGGDPDQGGDLLGGQRDLVPRSLCLGERSIFVHVVASNTRPRALHHASGVAGHGDHLHDRPGHAYTVAHVRDGLQQNIWCEEAAGGVAATLAHGAGGDADQPGGDLLGICQRLVQALAELAAVAELWERGKVVHGSSYQRAASARSSSVSNSFCVTIPSLAAICVHR